MKVRSLLAALVAAAVGFGSAGAAEAQLWKPKKKAATTTAPAVKKKKPTTAARKRPARKKPTSAVVRFKAPPERTDEDAGRSEDRDVDDRPRITVVDGDRDE